MNKNDKKQVLQKISEEFLEFINNLSEFIEDSAFPAYSQLRLDNFSRRRFYYNVKKFENAGLIKTTKENKHTIYNLTPKARLLRNKPSVKIHRIDGLSTIIIFDIPEDKRKVRDSFRRYLIKNGYTQIQKSVFISPFRVFNDLLEFMGEMGIKNNVSLISGKIDRLI